MWPDMEAVAGPDSLYGVGTEPGTWLSNAPSRGWDVLHRGNGKNWSGYLRSWDLNFTPEEQSSVTWFDLSPYPALVVGREGYSLSFEGVKSLGKVDPNQELVGVYLGEKSPFTIDITEMVFYVRDNHLAIRVDAICTRFLVCNYGNIRGFHTT